MLSCGSGRIASVTPGGSCCCAGMSDVSRHRSTAPFWAVRRWVTDRQTRSTGRFRWPRRTSSSRRMSPVRSALAAHATPRGRQCSSTASAWCWPAARVASDVDMRGTARQTGQGVRHGKWWPAYGRPGPCDPTRRHRQDGDTRTPARTRCRSRRTRGSAASRSPGPETSRTTTGKGCGDADRRDVFPAGRSPTTRLAGRRASNRPR